MRNILVPTDGSKPALRALEHAINLAKQHPNDCTLHVVNIQTPIVSHNVNRFFSAEAIQEYYNDEAQEVLQPLKKILDEAGVSYQTHVEVGAIGEVANKMITEHSCDHLVMGTRGLSPVSGLLLGSSATKILNAVDIPVTLIK